MNQEHELAVVEQLARAGNFEGARQELERVAQGGSADAAFILAERLLTGHPFGRDLAASRTWFAKAAELGNAAALDSFIAFTANGTGGGRDWKEALRLLELNRARNPDFGRQLQLISTMDLTPEGDPATHPAGEPLPQLPGASHFPNFLTTAECAYLIDVAGPGFRRSQVVDNLTGQFVADPIRKSDVAPFPLAAERPLLHAINRRAARASGTDVSHGEPLQILRYCVGQEYRQHHDAIPNADNQRSLTLLIYLNEDFEGGETIFPKVGLRFRGRLGEALLFRNVASGQPDPLAVHIGMPVTAGIKYLASRWIRERPLKLTL